MENLSFLQDLIVLFSMGTLVVIFFHRANLPPIVGFLITGIICGPHGLNIIEDPHNIEKLGEVGMILLLFSLGIELSFKKILDLGKFLMVGGFLQTIITIFLVSLIARGFGLSVSKSLFLGMLIALSSTALVLRYMADRGELDSLHGKTSFSILIFQDLIIVPMVLVTPFLAQSTFDFTAIGQQLLLALGFTAAAIFATRYIVPWILNHVVKTRNREAFLMSMMLLCAGTAWITGKIGLSATLGAFIAGLVISESKYSLQAISEVLPFREIFNSLFFVSVGMMFEPSILMKYPIIVVACVLSVILLKMIVTSMVTFFYGYSLRVAMLSGLALAQIGEFSFVLGEVGIKNKLLTETEHSLFLALAIGTMLATPFIRYLWPPLATAMNRIFPDAWSQGYLLTDVNQNLQEMKDHVIVVGNGPNGQQLVDVLEKVQIPFLIVEMNPETVKREQARGRRILYGDAARPEVLHKAYLEKARMVVIAIPDMSAAKRILYLVKATNPDVYVIVRSAYHKEIAELKKMGAHEVISQEFETSVKLFSHALEFYEIPRPTIEGFILDTRTEKNRQIHKEVTTPSSQSK